MDGEEKRTAGRRRTELLSYLRRLAKSRNSDVVKLAYLNPEDWQALDRLDLTGVAELRRGANGTFEVKFVDRVKVLDMLRGLLEETEGGMELLLSRVDQAEDGEDG